MHITDPVADMLTRVRNANNAKHETVDVPASNMKKSIAQILQQSFDTDDVIGRIGGDEFVAFCFLDDPHTPDHLCSKIKTLSEHLNETNGKPYYVDISLGVSTFICNPTLNIEDVLHQADESLYEHKKNKRKDVLKPV